MARMKAGTALKYTASDGKPLCVGDAFEYEGQQFFVSPFGSALDLSGEAFPLSKMSPDKIIRNTAGASAFCAVKSDAPEPVMAADISIFTDEDIAAELQRRGYVGTLTRTKTITNMTKDGYTYLLAQYASQFLPNVMANHPGWDFNAQIREARDMAAQFIKGIYGSVAEVK